MLYDIESDSSSVVLEVDYDRYTLLSATFLNEANIISFLSDKGISEPNKYDIWTLNRSTGEKTRVTDFEKAGFFFTYNFDWSPDGQSIYVSGYGSKSVNLRRKIYRYDLETRSLTDLLGSQWQDENPTISPNGTKLAFFSTRSGTMELWIYNMNTSRYRQVTGDVPDYFQSGHSTIQWLNDNELTINVYYGGKQKPVKVFVD
jgi:Tol biopolymer transport system component